MFRPDSEMGVRRCTRPGAARIVPVASLGVRPQRRCVSVVCERAAGRIAPAPTDLMIQPHSDDPEPPDEAERLRARVAHLERELEMVRSSARYRLGSVLIDLRTPAGWRRLPQVARAGWHRMRSRRPRPGRPVAQRPGRTPIVADSILDEFSQRCLAPELTLQPVGLSGRPQRDTVLLFAETAWQGNGGRWQHQFSMFRPGGDLDRLVARYRSSGVPTVLWNKEDPAHFELFIRAAATFDHVLTTDADCVERYRRELGHDRIGVMPFAAQPELHNPLDRHVDPRSICFAGAWRGDVHPQRVRQLTMLLDAALAVGDLTIFARSPLDGRADFPAAYHDSIVGEVPYDRMVDEYRRHACFLNVNTAVGSPTMMSRRVFEILACRTPVVSAPSPAIEAMLGDAVLMPSTRRQAVETLRELVDAPQRRDRLGQLGYRAVMSAHTYQHRVADLCRRLEIDGFPEPVLPTVDAVVEVPTRADIDSALGAAEPLGASIGSLVVVCRDADDVEIESRDGIAIVGVPADLAAHHIVDRVPGDGEYLALLDRRAHYGPAMISDAMLATRYIHADAYGKVSSHARRGARIATVGNGTEFATTSDLLPGTVVVRRATLSTSSGRSSMSLHSHALDAAQTMFAVDRFNHVAPADDAQPLGATVSSTDVVV